VVSHNLTPTLASMLRRAGPRFRWLRPLRLRSPDLEPTRPERAGGPLFQVQGSPRGPATATKIGALRFPIACTESSSLTPFPDGSQVAPLEFHPCVVDRVADKVDGSRKTGGP